METTRVVPTPRDIARSGPQTHSPAPAPTPTAPTGAGVYDRRSWERAVLSGGLHRNSRYIAFVLSHHADARGALPANGVQDAARLVELTGLSGKNVRLSLNYLQHHGYLTRPDIHTWPAERGVRPATLTMPPAAPGGRSHSGETG